MGAAYLSILENGPLAGIKDPQVMRYAVVVSYANGAGACCAPSRRIARTPSMRLTISTPMSSSSMW